MDRRNDFGAALAVALGVLLAGPFYGALLDARGMDVHVRFEPRMERRFEQRFERRFDGRFEGRRDGRRERRRAEGAVAGVAVGRCEAPFEIDSRSSGFRVVGEYVGVAQLHPEGLEIDLLDGSTSARFEDAQVQGIVFGWAQDTGAGQWSVTHTAEPIPLGDLRQGASYRLQAQGVLIPGVGLADLDDGWLVVEHVLDAPDAGGTAWTYAHAPRGTLAALQNEACLAESLLP
jgi:hypothetical protein